MTREVMTVEADASIVDAANIMLEKHISGLPVVDEGGHLVGIVSQGDFIRRAEIGTQRKRGRWLKFLLGPGRAASDFVHERGRKVGEIMTLDPRTVTEDATLEDIVEEIVGDITDEHDIAVPGVRPLPDGSVNVDGGVPVRDLNRVMDWNIPDDEATTIAGVVIHEARSIPEPGQSFTFHGFRFHVLRKTRNRITALRVAPLARKVVAKAS